MNQDKRTLLPGLSLFVCFCLLTGMEKLITHFNLPPSLMELGEIVCFGLALAMALPGMNRERFKQPVSYTHLRAHETRSNLVCRLLLEKIFFNDTATTEIYTRKIVGSVRCV